MVDFAGIPEGAAATARSKGQRVLLSRQQALVWLTLSGVVLLAVGLRLVPTVFAPSLNWGDEIFQMIEPAHRLVYGYGLVPWEFQLGMRSWLLPGLIGGLIELARLVGEGPDYYLPAISIAFALLAAAPVVCCFLWCRQWYGNTAALVGAAAVALAPEAVYFGARTLSEVMAAHILVIGCYLLAPGRDVGSRRRLFAAGLVFGLVCLLRIQLAPAIALFVVWVSWRDWRAHFPALIAGGAAALVLGAVLDWGTLGYPFASIWRNIVFNLGYGVSAEFGVEPWQFLILLEAAVWGPALPCLLLLAGLGARRFPALLIPALAIFAVHSGIAHKEYRFVYPAVLLLTVLAGFGLAQLTERAIEWLSARGLHPRAAKALSAAALICVWSIAAYAVWIGPGIGSLRQLAHDTLTAAQSAARFPQLCGIGLYGLDGHDWAWYGGYSYLHRPVPMYWPKDGAELAETVPAFDTLLYFGAAPPPEFGFTTEQCFGRICLARRPGRCAPQPMQAMPFPKPVSGLAPPKQLFEAVPAHMIAAGSR